MEAVMVSRSLERYMKDISKIPLLSYEQEVQLAQLARRGDKEAFERLVKANLRFVVKMAIRIYHLTQGVLPLEDLISEGNLGLLRAVERFDPTVGVRLCSYAKWWIHQRILQAIAEQSMSMIVRPSRNRVRLFNKISKSRSILQQRLQREPTISEIASELNMDISEEKVREIIEGIFYVAPGKRESVDNIADPYNYNEGFDRIEREELAAVLLSSLKRLTKRQKMVITIYGYGDDVKKMKDIAAIFECSPQNIQGIFAAALRRLKKNIKEIEKRIGQKVF